jgi:cytochrome c-type biogenesis protein CcmF
MNNAFLGNIAIKAVFIFLVYTFLTLLYGLFKKEERFVKSGQRAQLASTILTIIASSFLLYAIMNHDFSIRYVYEHSSTDLPFLYQISVFWGGQAGSLLFWLLVLSIYAAVVSYKSSRSSDPLHTYAVAVLSPIQLFFAFLLAFLSNPFETLPSIPIEGLGLNPMLQNPGMLIHPPAVYLGYVGFAVPFAYALAALILDRRDNLWIIFTRRWTIFAWLFLTVGNIWGGQWAYEELGWGGYWVWDPVENASLMPWLTGTAFLHSVMIQERKKMLKGWNLALITLTFELTLLGTFLTRSGVLASVHAFSESTLGRFFLIFIAISTSFVIYLSIERSSMLKGSKEIDALLSRESSFLLNNLLFVGMAFAVLWGTFFPLISEYVTGNKLSVGPPFFNKVNTPLGLTILFLMGICPLISWGRASWSNFRRNFLFPLAVALISLLFALALKVKGIALPIAIFGGVFVLTSVILEIVRGVKARQKLKGENLFQAFLNLFSLQRRRYGGYVIHLGVVMLFFGLIVHNTYTFKVEGRMKVGDSLKVGNYQLKAVEMVKGKKGNATIQGVKLALFNNGEKLSELVPAKAFYPTAEQPTSEVAIEGNFWRDIYVILDRISENEFSLIVFYNPFVAWIWASLYIMVLGTLIVMTEPQRRRSAIKES